MPERSGAAVSIGATEKPELVCGSMVASGASRGVSFLSTFLFWLHVRAEDEAVVPGVEKQARRGAGHAAPLPSGSSTPRRWEPAQPLARSAAVGWDEPGPEVAVVGDSALMGSRLPALVFRR